MSDSENCNGSELIELHEEERGSPRRRVLKGAKMTFNEMQSAVPCTVRDVSDTGARIKVHGEVYVPATFELMIELDGISVPCRVVWRSSQEAGVCYVGEAREVKQIRTQVITPHTLRKPSLRKQSF